MRNAFVFDFTTRQMAARSKDIAAHDDILGKLAAARRAKPGRLGEDDVRFMLMSNVIAGSDTTSTSLSAAIHYLLATPRALDRLRRELREKVEAGEVDGGDGRIVTQKVAEGWPYLQAVLFEAMRLHSVVGMLLPRVVPPGGLRFGEYYVPGGVSIGIIWAW